MQKIFNISEIAVTYTNKVPKSQRLKIKSSQDAFEIFLIATGANIEYRELFFILLLNNSNDVLGITKISEGGISSTLVDVRMVFQVALKAHACAMILCHNHPSGTLVPSNADKQLTDKIKKAGETLDIKILDHLIITQESYYSFTDEGIL